VFLPFKKIIIFLIKFLIKNHKFFIKFYLAKNNKIGVPDTYSFNIDPRISQSAFSSSTELTSRDSSMVMVNDTVSIRQSNIGTATKDFNLTQRNMSLNAGTSIDKVLDYAIRNSDYIQNQMAIPDGIDPQAYLQQRSQNENQPLNCVRQMGTFRKFRSADWQEY
jgi:hypothetical protein